MPKCELGQLRQQLGGMPQVAKTDVLQHTGPMVSQCDKHVPMQGRQWMLNSMHDGETRCCALSALRFSHRAKSFKTQGTHGQPGQRCCATELTRDSMLGSFRRK